jgi:hypothetical protein
MLATGYTGPMFLEDANLILRMAVFTGDVPEARHFCPDIQASQSAAAAEAMGADL